MMAGYFRFYQTKLYMQNGYLYLVLRRNYLSTEDVCIEVAFWEHMIIPKKHRPLSMATGQIISG